MSQGQNGAELRLVTPGSAIGPVSGRRVGTGALIQGDEIIATRVGHVRERHGTVSVDPVASCYMPRSGDLVIGTVIEARSNLWFLDINGPFQALLPMSLAPWKVEFGGTRDHADINDSLLMRVQEVDEVQNVVATMKGIGLRRLCRRCSAQRRCAAHRYPPRRRCGSSQAASRPQRMPTCPRRQRSVVG